MNNDLNTLVLRLYDLAQQASTEEFSQQILREIRPVIAFDSAAIYSLTLFRDRTIRFNACLSESDARDKLALRFKTVCSETLDEQGRVRSRDRLVERAFNRPGRSFHADVTAIGDKKLLAYARQFGTQHAFLHTARLGQDFGAVSLWRARAPNDYQLRDVAAGNLLLPHVFKALQINHKITALQYGHDHPTHCQIVCDESGNLLFSDGGANDLLGQEWAQWSPPYLPTPFLHELTRQGHYQGRCLRATVQSSARLFVIRLQAVAAGQQLTPAELTVARLAARDLSYKEVARELGTSPATVRNQLHSIYGKLNISGKAALGHALRAA
jgi:DNA-binding CsgD family transcriptional regulator